MKNKITNLLAKPIFLILVLLSCATLSFAQVPQFYNYNAGPSGNIYPLGSTSNNKVQWVYAPGVFTDNGTLLPSNPAYNGLITAVYFRASASNSSSFTDFTVSLAQNVGTQAVWANGTYNLGMIQVFQASSHNITSLANNWFAITLNSPFLYDPSQSLVVEMKQNGYSSGGISIRQDNSGGATRIWGGFANTTGSFGNGRADFGFDLLPPTPCDSISMVVGNLAPHNPTICSGQNINFTAPNATLGSGLTYQWQSSPNGTTWTNIAGAVNANYQTPPVLTTTHYRMIMTCTISNVVDTSVVSIVTVAPPSYANLPYSQDFENWVSYCSTSDVPDDYHWLNVQGSGNNAWRRDDQGPTAVWTTPPGGLYFPASSTGNYSARFHSYSTSAQGSLDLYVDCSTSTGNKTLSFDYINDNSSSGTDNLLIEYSTNGGSFFLPAAQYSSSIAWQSIFVSIPSNTPNTIIRFTASGGSNFVPGSDIGIDNIKVLAPCNGAPVAGTIDSTTACPNKPLVLNISGGTLLGGVNYRWESSPNATGPWTFVPPNTAGPTFSTTITTPTYWRCILTCTATNQSDTTPVRFVDVLPFYICYCDNAATTLQFENVGNVTVRDKIGNPPILNNGNPLPSLNNNTAINPYSLFQNITPTPIFFRDSSYYIDISGISYINSFNNCWAKVWIDYNRDGVYNVTGELAASGPITAASSYMMLDSFTVPSITNYGLTGMRVVLQEGANVNTVIPCGSFGRGEVEDYVIDLQLLPCNSPPYAGISVIDDSTTCVNNTIRIANNTHDRYFANLNFSWQESTDGVTFSDIPGGNVDTMFRVVTQDMWYRYRVTCLGTSNAYSNAVKVRILPPGPCIGSSMATGPNDKSDIGAVVVSDPPPTNTNLYTYSTGGPHLNNPASYKFYTNRTTQGTLDLALGNTYKLSVYHILNTAIHSDAQVSVFIDYNGDQTFGPGERVYNGVTTAASFFLNNQITIPTTAIQNTPVIMRVVLNDDLSTNTANTTGFGMFTSGETEDYYVRFKQPIGTNDVFSNINQVGIYPNPTPDELNIDFTAKQATNVTIQLLSLTGSIIKTKYLGMVNGQQQITLDLKDLAKGVYILKFNAEGTSFVRKVTVK